jgi:hypothetical protein
VIEMHVKSRGFLNKDTMDLQSFSWEVGTSKHGDTLYTLHQTGGSDFCWYVDYCSQKEYKRSLAILDALIASLTDFRATVVLASDKGIENNKKLGYSND